MALAAFIDLAVAVVVFAVTDFGLSSDLSGTDGILAVIADARTDFADALAGKSAFAVGCTSLVRAGITLFGKIVDFAVTIVVFAVANFGLWCDFAFARSPQAIGACLFSGFTSSDTGVFAMLIEVASGFGRVTFAGDTIDRAVTIVVNAIAFFFSGQSLSEANRPFSVGTGLCPCSANAFAFSTRRAGVASAGEAIDISIAIVIQTIAGFRLWRDFSDTWSPLLCLGAGLRTGLTNAFAISSRWA